ncbi:DNA excision repair protein ERCC-8 [Holothuria leucospilota]|uniref:DNA excision repair protein ERCC-8 n=1 Tax=Holothuria leucospilota TaxID=206669 RepID=A0A9Q1C9K0_HOLLE|nr:DNA excision repair protein ERCC-8 [Holothuria leucospilota]
MFVLLINFGKVVNDSGKSVKIACSVGSNPSAAFIPSTNDVDVYDLQNGEMVYDLKGHYHNVNCCTFHPHLQELYTGGNDSNVLVWEPDLGRHLDADEEEKDAKKDGVSSTMGIMLGAQYMWTGQQYCLNQQSVLLLIHGAVMKTIELILERKVILLQAGGKENKVRGQSSIQIVWNLQEKRANKN